MLCFIKNRTRRNFKFIICAILSFFTFLQSQQVCGQDYTNKEESLKIVDELNNLKRNNKIPDSTFVNAVFEWTEMQSPKGFYYEKDTIENKLELFRQTISKSNQQQANHYLINYYLYLFDNAAFSRRQGEAMYYIEKVDNEIAKLKVGKSLKSVTYQAELYAARKNYSKVKSLYNEHKEYILSIPQLLLDKKLDLNIAVNLSSGLQYYPEAFAKLEDTLTLNEIVSLSQQLTDVFKVQIRKETLHFIVVQFFNQNVKFEKAINQTIEKGTIENILFIQDSLINEAAARLSTHPYVEQLRYTALINKISFFNEVQQNDSTLYYVEKFFKIPHIDPEQTLDYKRLYAEILFKTGKTQAAFETLNSIFNSKDSLYNIVMEEQDYLQYAYILAEDRQAELLQAEKAKHIQTLIITALIILSLIIISLLYWFYTRNSKRAQLQIEELNKNANIQVALIEEIKSQAIKDEQQRLGRDLHDDISANVASIKLRLEKFKPTVYQADGDKLQSILKDVETVYHRIRNKSSQWYNASEGLEEKLFSSQIAALTNSIFSNSNYEININIDDSSLKATDTQSRIELLRIIQEGITNIFKHSKAKKIDILLFEDKDSIILSIKDDGIGIHKKNSFNSMGLQSIKDRCRKLGAQLSIHSSKLIGTEILVQMPLPENIHFTQY